MPSLVLFNRKWRIASDDFLVPGGLFFFHHVLWLGLLYAALVLAHNAESSEFKSILLWMATVIGWLGIVLSLCLMRITTTGLIMQTRKRKGIHAVLYLLLLLCLCEAIWAITATRRAWITHMNSKSPPVTILEGCAVLWSWVSLIAQAIFIVLLFDPLGHIKQHNDMTTRKAWEKIFRAVFCCIRPKVSPYDDMAKVHCQLFSNMDWAPTDVMAGLVLLREKHEPLCCGKGLSGQVSARPHPLDLLNEEQCITVLRAHHFAKYAAGCYGWPYYVGANLCNGLCVLGCGSCCCGSGVPSESGPRGPCGKCHLNATMAITKMKGKDLIYYTTQNKAYESPFYVALDHHQKAVLVCIRGTMSFGDLLTDLSASPCPLTALEGGWAHSGMLLGAQFVVDELMSKKVLERAFALQPSYQLVIVGHSLGAGLAILIGLLLRKTYKDLQCYAYSPPGGLVSQSVATYCRAFVTSVVVGDDIVPRTSLSTLEQFRDEMEEVLRACALPKYKVLKHGIWCYVAEALHPMTKRDQTTATQPMLATNQQSTYAAQNDEVHLSVATSGLPSGHLDCDVRFLAGQILHLVRSGTETQDNWLANVGQGEHSYKAIWASPSDFDRIYVSPTAVTDHIPTVVLAALTAVVKEMTAISGTSLPPKPSSSVTAEPVGFLC